MAKFTPYRVSNLPTSNIDEKGLYFLELQTHIDIYLRRVGSWVKVGEAGGAGGDVDTVNGLTGDVEVDLDFTSGKLKVAATGTGTPVVTAQINLDTRYEQLVNKVSSLSNPNNTNYPTTLAVDTAIRGAIKGLYEEHIPGSRMDVLNLNYNLNLDWNSYKVFVVNLIGSSGLVDLNLPSGNFTKVIEILATGNHTLNLPLYWIPLPGNDNYDGTVYNHIVVTCIKGSTTNRVVLYSLQNVEISQ